MLTSLILLSGLFASTMAQQPTGPSRPVNYCSDLNTADTPGNYSIHQTQGLCYDFCVRKVFALAVVQGNYCWCSNYVPASSKQVSPGQCNKGCPGYPTDVCGTDTLFGYMLGQQSPSGTTGAGQQASSTTTSRPAPTTPTIETVTEEGTVRTVTVMPTPNPTGDMEQNRTNTPAPVASDNNGGSSGLSTGATAGVAVGTIAIATIAIVSAFLFYRRRKQRRDDESLGHSPRGSSAGMGSPRSTEPGMAQTDGRPWDLDQSGRRRSTLMPIDPRIDPTHTGFYNREQNTSRDSINTLRDDQDYSRKVHQPTKVLRATNPDPDN